MPKKQDPKNNEEMVDEPSSQTQQIFDAISDNDINALKRLYTSHYLSAKALDAKTNSTQSKLLHAASLGHSSIVKFLLFQKHDYINLHDFNEANQNPLLSAIENGFSDVVRVMASHPFFFRKSFKDNAGNTPFHYVGNIKDEAIRKEMASILIAAGMSFEFVNHKNLKPNHYAEYLKIKQAQKFKYHSSLAEHLFIKPRSENLKDNLMPASLLCLSSGLIALLNPVIGLSIFTLSGGYFLTCLQTFKEDKAFKHKLQNAQNEADFIHYILTGKLTQAIFDKYQKQGVDVHHLQTTYQSALDLAAQSGHLASVKLLMKNGFIFKNSALNTAIDYGHLEIAEYFLSLKNVDIDLDNKDSATPLTTALHAHVPSRAMVKMLLDKGAYTGESTFLTKLMDFLDPSVPPKPSQGWKSWFSQPEPPKVQPKKTFSDYVNFIAKNSDSPERREDFLAFAKFIENANKQRKTKTTASNEVLPALNNARNANKAKSTAKHSSGRPLQQQKETISRKKKVV